MVPRSPQSLPLLSAPAMEEGPAALRPTLLLCSAGDEVCQSLASSDPFVPLDNVLLAGGESRVFF